MSNETLHYSDFVVTDSGYNHTAQYQLTFSSANTTRACVNVTISDNDVLETNKSLQLALSSESSYVLFQNPISELIIIDDDREFPPGNNCVFIIFLGIPNLV